MPEERLKFPDKRNFHSSSRVNLVPSGAKQVDRLNIPANECEGTRQSSRLTATCPRLLAGSKEAQTIGVTGCDNSLEIVTGPVCVITVVVTRRNLVIATSARRDTRARSGYGDFGTRAGRCGSSRKAGSKRISTVRSTFRN